MDSSNDRVGHLQGPKTSLVQKAPLSSISSITRRLKSSVHHTSNKGYPRFLKRSKT